LLAQRIARTPSLRFRGLHAYQGGAQHLRAPAERRAAIAAAAAFAAKTKAAIETAGIACPVITGAGTGTWQHERDSGVYTEIQPGSYIFMDVDYHRNALAPDEHHFEQSLYVVATVMSAPARERAVVDAGLKALAFDSGPPQVYGAHGLDYTKASDELVLMSPPTMIRSFRAIACGSFGALRSNGQPLRLDRRHSRLPRRSDLAGRGTRRDSIEWTCRRELRAGKHRSVFRADLQRYCAARRAQHCGKPCLAVVAHAHAVGEPKRRKRRAGRCRIGQRRRELGDRHV
jgi:hypothetical protein